MTGQECAMDGHMQMKSDKAAGGDANSNQFTQPQALVENLRRMNSHPPRPP